MKTIQIESKYIYSLVKRVRVSYVAREFVHSAATKSQSLGVSSIHEEIFHVGECVATYTRDFMTSSVTTLLNTRN